MIWHTHRRSFDLGINVLCLGSRWANDTRLRAILVDDYYWLLTFNQCIDFVTCCVFYEQYCITYCITHYTYCTVHSTCSADVECWVRNDMMRYQMSEELLWLAGVGASVTDPSWNMTDIRMICRTSLSHNSWYVALVPVPTLIIHHIITLHIIMFQISNVSCSHHTHIQLSEINFGPIFVFYYYNIQ